MSTYYLAIHTQTDYDAEAYPDVAGKLAALLTNLLANKERITSFCGESVDAYIEVEVAIEPCGGGRELVGKAVLELSTEAKFDKGKFSKCVKASPLAELWPDMKIAKRELTHHSSPAAENSA